MARMLAAVLAAALAIALTLLAMFALVRATIAIAQMTNPLARALAVIAELTLGVVLLLGTVYLATQLAVRIFGPGEPGADR